MMTRVCDQRGRRERREGGRKGGWREERRKGWREGGRERGKLRLISAKHLLGLHAL